SAHEPRFASWIVGAAHGPNGDRHCCVSRWQNRCISTAAAWSGSGAASEGCPETRPPGSDRSPGSGRAVSTPGVSYSRLAMHAALLDATIAVHRVAGIKTRPAGALPV